MMLRTHLAFAFLVSLIFLHFFPVNPYIFVALACLAAFLVDMDLSSSRAGRNLWPLSWLVEKFFGHRGLLHSLLAAVLVFAVSLYVLNLNIFAFAPFLGYMSHLFLDAFTVSGIPFFKPLSGSRVSGPVSTGSLVEHIIFFLLLALDSYLLLLY